MAAVRAWPGVVAAWPKPRPVGSATVGGLAWLCSVRARGVSGASGTSRRPDKDASGLAIAAWVAAASRAPTRWPNRAMACRCVGRTMPRCGTSLAMAPRDMGCDGGPYRRMTLCPARSAARTAPEVGCSAESRRLAPGVEGVPRRVVSGARVRRSATPRAVALSVAPAVAVGDGEAGVWAGVAVGGCPCIGPGRPAVTATGVSSGGVAGVAWTTAATEASCPVAVALTEPSRLAIGPSARAEALSSNPPHSAHKIDRLSSPSFVEVWCALSGNIASCVGIAATGASEAGARL